MAPGFFFFGKIHGHRSYKAWDRIAGFLRGNAHAVQRLFRAKSPPGTENLLYERFCKPTPDFFPQCQDHGPDCREVSGLLREHEDAEKPGDRQAETECCAPPQFAHRAGWHLRGVQVRVRVRGLAEIQMCIADCGGNGRGSADFEPSGKDWVGLQELGADGGWDDDVLEKLRQQVIEPCLQQCGDRGSVADDKHWSAAYGRVPRRCAQPCSSRMRFCPSRGAPR